MSKNFEDTKWHSYTSSTQTMRTWAIRLKTYEDVPEEFQPAFPDAANPFPYTVVIPEDKLSRANKRNKQMISAYDDHFLLLEQIGDETESVSVQFADVLYLERGIILLYSWLEIVTASGSFTLTFNTTNEALFNPIIEKIRQGMSGDHAMARINGGEKGTPDLAQFDYLESVNYKYLNYGRKSIRPSDSVVSIAYQPEQTIKELSFFHQTIFRRYKTSHLAILTAQELILIREPKSIRTSRDNTDGGVFTYIPRRQIRNLSFAAGEENTQYVMEIALPENEFLACEFSSANEELKRLQQAYEAV
ncbi:MAG: hypothetical protein KBE23_11590 [Chloroflexi bacterium]|nr:hypothetical protein [Chloroflexota bacterium]MBP7043377.1 hypothetical protein [Chloroflexota bacterium]